ncbi:hypothetical protein VKT23_005920 [Stygiomarasmius scandens]|uniref:Heterokaryon incompatibility domain-containing protein n=1 Tax=Marasmiellus scandens TaxID=2682957 RepID=A0ABR1JV41_9AGAR
MQAPEDVDEPHIVPHLIEFTLPYLCSSMPYDYDTQGFWDFPERAGWMLDGKALHRKFPNHIVWPSGMHDLDVQYACRSRTIPENRLAKRPRDSLAFKCFRITGEQSTLSEEVAFLQAWLFFGVLAEVSSICGLPVDPDEQFLVVEDGSQVVSTGALNNLLHKWLMSLNATPADVARERVGRLLRVEYHVMSLQTIISTYGDAKKPESRALSYSECKVLLSIRFAFRAILLVCLLSKHCELTEIQFLLDSSLEQSFPAQWDELKGFATQELLDNDWCRSECKLLEQMDGSYNFFATLLKRWRMDHGKCDDFTCLADQINEEIYQTAHVEAQCHCKSMGLDPEELRSILEKGNVPRIEISDKDELFVREDRLYVAISHVCMLSSFLPNNLLSRALGSHGLGNPHENSLPLCQIRRLRQHLSRLQVTGELLPAIWIDTLCIPVAKHLREYRKRAIELMGQTYKNAEVVLVLDRELQHVDPRKVPVVQVDLLKAFVGWTRRLWTLQEAALAKKVYIEVLGRLEPIQMAPQDETEALLSRIRFREDLSKLLSDRIPPSTVLRQKTKVDRLELGGGLVIVTTRTALQSLCFAVKHRSTSKMEDEAVILAITLGMDVKDLVGLRDVDERMAKFLQMMQDVPCDIIFGDWERVRYAPYRWALKSLLNFPITKLDSFAPPGICDSRGLHATYQGFVLAEAASGQKAATDNKYFAVDRSSGMRYEFWCQNSSTLPQKPALIFRPNNVNEDVAIVNVLQDVSDSKDASEPLIVNVVGYLKLVASGGLDFSRVSPDNLLEGTMTSVNQAWIVT